jgi:hypothetical protein
MHQHQYSTSAQDRKQETKKKHLDGAITSLLSAYHQLHFSSFDAAAFHFASVQKFHDSSTSNGTHSTSST